LLLTFSDYELDSRLFALRYRGQTCRIEPLVFNLLLYLAQQRDRVVTRQELMDAVWARKVVSESTLSSSIKAARRAIGDNGDDQRCIATIHGRGYRFVADVQQTESDHVVSSSAQLAGSPPALQADAPITPSIGERASVAVMPFAALSQNTCVRGGTSDALTHDIITRLAQMRSLFVIAQGTVFALQERDVGAGEAGRLLKVDYVVSGTVRRLDQHLVVTAELIETCSARLLWSEIIDHPLVDAFLLPQDISNKIVCAIANEIELAERNRAMLRPASSLSAWEAYHRGLWHMYRFDRRDNETAQRFFDQAIALDPTFSGAYAGKSFTHFQNSFQGWGVRRQEVDLAYASAGRSLSADDRNPTAHWAMGRALWLRGDQRHSVDELEQAIALSPSFALGHYTLAFVQAQAGDPVAAISYSDHSQRLSPFDPLLFGMLGARAIALVRLERFPEAADCAAKAAARPNAHIHILAIAAFTHALSGSLEAARAHAAAVQKALPGYTFSDFLGAFQLDSTGRAWFAEGATRIGMA